MKQFFDGGHAGCANTLLFNTRASLHRHHR